MAPLIIIRQGGKQIECKNDCFRNQSCMERRFKAFESDRHCNHKQNIGRSSIFVGRSGEEKISTTELSIRDNQVEESGFNENENLTREIQPCRDGSLQGDDYFSGESSEDDDDANQIDSDANQKNSQQLYSSSPPHIRHIHAELHLVECMRPFRCAMCGSVVADQDDVISKTFFGQTGKAFLMNNMYNFCMGSSRNRYLMTGLHTICDVHCSCCSALLGWKYVSKNMLTMNNSSLHVVAESQGTIATIQRRKIHNGKSCRR